MPDYLSDADLTYAEIHAEHHPERITPETVRALVEEVYAWRDFGSSPDLVADRIESLEWEIEHLNEKLDALEGEEE